MLTLSWFQFKDAAPEIFSVFRRWAPKATHAGILIASLALVVLPETALPFVIAVREGIDCNGNSITTDSFDSANATQSTMGLYDPTKASTNGDIACLAGVAQLGTANINGALFLTPDAAYEQTNNGAVSGGVYTNLNYVLPDVVLPQTIWLPPITTNLTIATTIGTNSFFASYQYVFGPGAPYPNGSGYYVVSGAPAAFTFQM